MEEHGTAVCLWKCVCVCVSVEDACADGGMRSGASRLPPPILLSFTSSTAILPSVPLKSVFVSASVSTGIGDTVCVSVCASVSVCVEEYGTAVCVCVCVRACG